MSYSIALQFDDGSTRFVKCKPHESLADAAYRQGVNIPIDCREGACGTCKCLVESGSYAMGDYVEDALSASEAKQGYALSCQLRPESNCVISIPVEASRCNVHPASIDATVKCVTRLSESSFSLRLEGSTVETLDFLPGQYAKIQLPDGTGYRAYSFSSLIRQDSSVDFLIRNVQGGRMSTWLSREAKPGDQIRLVAPFGSFYLRPIQRPVLMLAGGTGLAPFLAMLEKIKDEGGSSFPIHLVYGVNRDEDLVETGRLASLSDQIPNFSFSCCVVDEQSVQPRKGYVTSHIEPTHLHDGGVDIYLCGPPPMVESVVTYLGRQGVTPVGFYHEKFSASN